MIFSELMETLRDLLGFTKQANLQRELIIRQNNLIIFVLSQLAEDTDTLGKLLAEIAEQRAKIVGLVGTHTPPVQSANNQTQQENKKMSVKMIKKSQLKKGAANVRPKLHRPGDAAPSNFLIMDNEDTTCTVFGTDGTMDANGNPTQIDISQVATLGTPVSSDPSLVTADPPVGMTFAEHALAVGSPNVTVVATWNDDSVGPFTFIDNLVISAPVPPAVTGLVVTHSAPTVRTGA